MNKQTEALKMAIAELEKGEGWMDNVSATIQACKEALKQPAQFGAEYMEGFNAGKMFAELEQPAQEPVAWLLQSKNKHEFSFSKPIIESEYLAVEPLYTHPAPSWQGLSDDEIQEELKKMWDKGLIPSYSIVAFARAIEQALKEKNT